MPSGCANGLIRDVRLCAFIPSSGAGSGRVDKTRQNALPLGRFAEKFVARAVRGGPMNCGASAVLPRTTSGAPRSSILKLRPGPSALEEPCDGNRSEEGGWAMRLALRLVVASSLLIAAVSFTAAVADEPKHGGILKIYHRDSPPSASIHEEATYSTVIPFMPIFNNLVMYKQDVAQNSFQSIVPDLASSWSWSEDKTELTFKLRQGVKWHDGKPFTANDVK